MRDKGDYRAANGRAQDGRKAGRKRLSPRLIQLLKITMSGDLCVTHTFDAFDAFDALTAIAHIYPLERHPK